MAAKQINTAAEERRIKMLRLDQNFWLPIRVVRGALVVAGEDMPLGG
jgi:hypothetical protein